MKWGKSPNNFSFLINKSIPKTKKQAYLKIDKAPMKAESINKLNTRYFKITFLPESKGKIKPINI